MSLLGCSYVVSTLYIRQLRGAVKSLSISPDPFFYVVGVHVHGGLVVVNAYTQQCVQFFKSKVMSSRGMKNLECGLSSTLIPAGHSCMISGENYMTIIWRVWETAGSPLVEDQFLH
mgnify:CR=1 FL=1